MRELAVPLSEGSAFEQRPQGKTESTYSRNSKEASEAG